MTSTSALSEAPVLPVQGSPEWLELRKSKIGSSDVAAIMGVSPYGTAYSTWLNKTGRAQEKEVNLAMMRGTEAEAKIRALYELQTGNDCPPSVVQGQGVDWAMVSLDGLSEDGTLILEIKYPGKDTHETARQGKVPEHYYPQVQYQLLVTGAKRAHYVSYQENEDGVGSIEIVPVTPDKEFWAKMLPALEAFWQCVVTDTPPPLCDRDWLEPSDATSIELFERWKKAKLMVLQFEDMVQNIGTKMKEEASKLEAAREQISAMMTRHPKIRCAGVRASMVKRKNGPSLTVALDDKESA